MEQGLGGPRASLRIPPLVIAAVRFGWDQELGPPAGQTPPWQRCLGIEIGRLVGKVGLSAYMLAGRLC